MSHRLAAWAYQAKTFEQTMALFSWHISMLTGSLPAILFCSPQSRHRHQSRTNNQGRSDNQVGTGSRIRINDESRTDSQIRTDRTRRTYGYSDLRNLCSLAGRIYRGYRGRLGTLSNRRCIPRSPGCHGRSAQAMDFRISPGNQLPDALR